MFIPIPYGSTTTLKVYSDVWKFVHCEYCDLVYAYCIEIEASGSGFNPLFLAEEYAQQQAIDAVASNLSKKSQKAAAAVPCPECGSYQRDMTSMVRRKYLHWTQIAGGLVLAFCPAFLVLDLPYGWEAAAGITIVGGSLMIWGMRCRRSIDPNAGDPEPRKQFGRSHAVWGEKLEFLVKELQG